MRTRYLKVGVAVIVVAVASYFLLRLLAPTVAPGGTKRYWAYFHDATGLVDKSNVQIAGLNVGEIVSRTVEYQKWTDARGTERMRAMAKVTVGIDKTYTLYENAIIFKKQSSLLGGYYLEIDPGTPESPTPAGGVQKNPVIPDGGQIKHVAEAATIGDTVSQIQELMPILRDILEDVRRLTSGPVTQSAEKIQKIIDQNAEVLTHLIANIDRVAADVEAMTGRSRGDVIRTVENLRNITDSVRAFLGTPTGDGGMLAPTTAQVRSTLDKLSSAAEKLDRALGDVASMTETARENNLAENVSSAAETIADVAQDAGGFVSDVVRLKTIVSLRSEYNFYAQTLKTYLGIEVRPRPDKYYLIELIDDPRGSVHRTRTLTSTDDPNRPPYVVEDKTEISEAFRFSFQFGKRIDWIGFRFGIKESTGGVGIDTFFFNDRLTVSTDLFDFKSNVLPRLKILGAWEFFRYLYVVGGADDLLNQESRQGTGGGRDFFVGAQLRFNDEDLKGLLLFGGGMIAGAAAGK